MKSFLFPTPSAEEGSLPAAVTTIRPPSSSPQAHKSTHLSQVKLGEIRLSFHLLSLSREGFPPSAQSSVASEETGSPFFFFYRFFCFCCARKSSLSLNQIIFFNVAYRGKVFHHRVATVLMEYSAGLGWDGSSRKVVHINNVSLGGGGAPAWCHTAPSDKGGSSTSWAKFVPLFVLNVCVWKFRTSGVNACSRILIFQTEKFMFWRTAQLRRGQFLDLSPNFFSLLLAQHDEFQHYSLPYLGFFPN